MEENNPHLMAEFIAFRTKYCGISASLDKVPLSDTWYNNFLARNKLWIKVQKAKIVETCREDWCTPENCKLYHDRLCMPNQVEHAPPMNVKYFVI